MKYIKRFSTHSEYEGYVSGNPETPNISACDDDVWATFHCINSGMTKNEPLCFTPLVESTMFSYRNAGGNNPNIQYSRDKIKWLTWNELSSITVELGSCLYVRGDNPNHFNLNSSTYTYFSSSHEYKCSGNVMSLLGEYVKEIPNSNCFYGLFKNSGSLIEGPELPATALTIGCYSHMFENCYSLIKTPELLATSINSRCYDSMFAFCKSLTVAPSILPALVLFSGCYTNMFSECSSLKVAPSLPAKELVENCYRGMFAGCISLTVPPALLAESLSQGCYYQMFRSCFLLNNITMTASENITETEALTNFLQYTNTLGGVFVKRQNVSIDSGTTSMPYGWKYVDWDQA